MVQAVVILKRHFRGKDKYKKMKRKLLLLAAFYSISALFADDAHVECYGGGAGTVNSDRQYFVIGQDEDIAMTAEHVLITMYEDYYTVDAKF